MSSSGRIGFGGGVVLALVAGCVEPAPDGRSEAALDGDCSAPGYAPWTPYPPGARVSVDGEVYRCKAWPYSGWCGAGPAYAPGTGWAWQDAWELVAGCDGGGDPEPEPEEPEPDEPDPEEPDPDEGDGWRQANLTWFTAYPEPGSEECEDYNGCQWAGYFAFVEGQQSEAWVASHDIAAVHSDDAGAYALKTLRVRQGSHQIDVTVYDMCSDADCDGCCTANRGETGFLIDLEQHTMERFGSSWGVVEWTCLDCDD
jgi:hypothetical protein